MTPLRIIIPQHKALRILLDRIVYYAGNSDFQNTAQLQYFKTLIHEFNILFTDHHFTEHNYILKMAAERHPPEHDFDAEMFASISSILSAVLKQMGQVEHLSQKELDHAYSDLLSFEETFNGYMRMQDSITEGWIQHDYSQREICNQIESNIRRMSDPVLLLWCRYLVPANPDKESALFLKIVRSLRHQHVYDSIIQALKHELYPERYDSILRKVETAEIP